MNEVRIPHPLILASASKRRKALLRGAGVPFQVIPAQTDETLLPDEVPSVAVVRLAEAKASAVAGQYSDAFVLAADTLVVLEHESQTELGTSTAFKVLGKPNSEADAQAMLKDLQGRSHTVITGFCLMRADDAYCVCRVVETKVRLKQLSDEIIARYVATGEPFDKAGSYAIQGIMGNFVDAIDGSYSNVVGLPMSQVLSELELCGMWDSAFMFAATGQTRENGKGQVFAVE